MNDLDNLYKTTIMAHYKNPHNKGLLEDDSYNKSKVKNAACGDDITVQAKIENNVISDIRYDGKGCSIMMSSGSVMSEALIGKTKDAAQLIINNYFKIIIGEDYDKSLDYQDAEAYAGVQKFPARINCASLAWRAIDAILNN